jgi:excisionase family DNA binding protein
MTTRPTRPPGYLRTSEVADLLHVSPKTVSRWSQEGKLPFQKTLGGQRRYPEADIRDLAGSLRVEPETSAVPTAWTGQGGDQPPRPRGFNPPRDEDERDV